MREKDIFFNTDSHLSDEEIIKRINEKVSGEDKDGTSCGYDTTPVYSVKELADKLETSVHTVRYYDNEHLFPYVYRSENNERHFSHADYAYGKMILCLRGLGLSIHDCRVFILNTMEGDETAKDRLKILLGLNAKLENQIRELSNSLNDLQYKIRYYSYLNQIVEEEKRDNTFVDKKRGSMRNLHDFVLSQKAFIEEVNEDMKEK
ncbi:MAG: MerR family transcriptional regulator [Erysipelotrichaceae bacterium]|nr:MerR family transcriptional regulator [Erysipelotrichaceae bacterium]